MASNAQIRTRSYTIQMRTYSIRWAWADAVVQSAKYGNIDIFIIHFFTQMLCISNHTHTQLGCKRTRQTCCQNRKHSKRKVYAQTPTGRHKSWLVGLLMPSPKFVLSKESEYVLIDDAGKKMVENAAIDCHRWI